MSDACGSDPGNGCTLEAPPRVGAWGLLLLFVLGVLVPSTASAGVEAILGVCATVTGKLREGDLGAALIAGIGQLGAALAEVMPGDRRGLGEPSPMDWPAWFAGRLCRAGAQW